MADAWLKNREEDKLEELRRAREREMNMMLEARLGHHYTHRRRIKTEGKGRRCCLGDRINSIPCRAIYFVPGKII